MLSNSYKNRIVLKATLSSLINRYKLILYAFLLSVKLADLKLLLNTLVY